MRLILFKILIILILLGIPLVSISQKICCDIDYNFHHGKLTKEIYSNYLKEHSDITDLQILLIDFKTKDSLIYFRVALTDKPLMMFYKTPDCYISDANKLIYLYTSGYTTKKSIDFRQSLFYQTEIRRPFPEPIVDWDNNTIYTPPGSTSIQLISSYSPIIEYTVYPKGRVLSKKVSSMFYEDNENPKIIRLSE